MTDMSDEELLGRLGSQYKRSNERVRRFEVEARQIAKVLSELSHQLQEHPQNASPLTPEELDRDLKFFPTGDQLRQLFSDLTQAREDRDTAKQELQTMGLTVY